MSNRYLEVINAIPGFNHLYVQVDSSKQADNSSVNARNRIQYQMYLYSFLLHPTSFSQILWEIR